MDLHRSLLDTIAGMDGMSTDDYHARMNQLLAPVSVLVSSEDCQKICAAITADRDGNDVFDMKDLELLACDVPAVVELAKACAMVLVTLYKVKFKYSAGMTEDLMLKLLCYVLVVVLPEQTDRRFASDEIQRIATVAFAIYDNIESIQSVKAVFNETIAAFHKRNLCMCVAIHDDPQQVLDAKLPAHVRSLAMHVQKNRMLASSSQTAAEAAAAGFEIIQIK